MKAIDATLGLGGHSREILKAIGPKGELLAFEQDEANLKEAKQRLAEFKGRVTFAQGNFETIKATAKEAGFEKVNAILFDLGLSSPHVEDAARGFSFRKEGPLDMRFDRSSGITAEQVVNTFSPERLADIFRRYGEEPRAWVIAKKIVQSRKTAPLRTTTQLAELIQGNPRRFYKMHPATLVFQALRLFVNRELEVLEKALKDAVDLLEPQGRIAVIAYHSLEDRLVKNTFRYFTQTCICPRELPVCQCHFQKKLYILTRKPIIPTGIEVSGNPRSRSAKLRVAERL